MSVTTSLAVLNSTVLVTDSHFTIQGADSSLHDVLGYVDIEVINRPLNFLFNDSQDLLHLTLPLFADEASAKGETVLKGKGGVLLLMEISISRLSIGKSSFFSFVLTDRTNLRRAEEQLKNSEERHRAIYNQAYIGIARLSKIGRFLMINERLSNMLGYTHDELRGMTFYELLKEEEREKNLTEWDELLSGKIENFSKEQRYLHRSGKEIYTNVTVSLVRDTKGNPSYFVSVFDDITERKKYEEELLQTLNENQILLREVHHRVKNNMQVISSLLNLQSGYLKDEAQTVVFKETQARIKAMSLVHDCIYQSKSFNQVNIRNYLSQITANVRYAFHRSDIQLVVNSLIHDSILDIDTSIPLGILLNELLSNAIKHGYESGSSGIVDVIFEEGENKDFVLIVKDDGKGMKEVENIENCDSLGLQLISILSSQLNGQIIMRSKQNEGTEFEIRFKKSE